MNLIINDFCQSLSSGISVCIDLGTTSKFSVANPYEIFKHISFTSLLNRMISDEVLLRGSVLQSGVRRSLLNTRGFKGFGLVPNLQFNTNTKMMSGNINFLTLLFCVTVRMLKFQFQFTFGFPPSYLLSIRNQDHFTFLSYLMIAMFPHL